MAGRKSFVFYFSWVEALGDLPEEVRYELYDAIIGYARTGKVSDMKPLAKVAFNFIKEDIDNDARKYEETAAKRSEAGRRSGESRRGKRTSVHFVEHDENRSFDDGDDDVDDDVSHNVCDDSARECAGTTTPHTDADFYFMTFWRRNVFRPAHEARRFVDHYEPAGWKLEGGDYLATDAARLAKARNWKTETAGERFPPGFMPAWEELAAKAPEDVRAAMYDDGVAVKTDGKRITALVTPDEVKRWMTGEGGREAKRLLIDTWLGGYEGRNLRIMTYKI